ncbi:MAG: 50S ribosomal protein L10 [Planctomycetaceae bacterium]|nr:MAG: 50S ribosomal protein L10 [Planctomycetaceae bacterium]
MSKFVKEMMIADIQARVGSHREMLVVDVSKVDGVTATKWRAQLRSRNIRVLGVKNALARRALRTLGVTGIDKALEGPSALVFGGEDIVALARELLESIKDIKTIQVKGGAMGVVPLSAEEVEQISKSPGRRELLSQIAGAIVGCGGRLSAAIQGPAGRLAACVQTIAEKDQLGEAN